VSGKAFFKIAPQKSPSTSCWWVIDSTLFFIFDITTPSINFGTNIKNYDSYFIGTVCAVKQNNLDEETAVCKSNFTNELDLLDNKEAY